MRSIARPFSIMFFLVALLLSPLSMGQGRGGAFGDDPFGALGGVEPGQEVVVRAEISKRRVAAGDQLIAAVVLQHAPSWHTWPNKPVLPEALKGFPATATQVRVRDLPDGVRVGPLQWPATSPEVVNYTGEDLEIQFYKGEAVIFVPLLVDADASIGERRIVFEAFFQACDDRVCLPPTTVAVTLSFSVVALEEREGDAASALFAPFDPRVFADAGAWGREPVASAETGDIEAAPGRSFFGIPMPSADSPGGIAVIVLLAALGGLILNLTPCVLPVIPIKVMTISQHGKTPGKSFFLGLWMAIGVVAFWVGIGLLAVSVTSFADPSRLFGIWWVTLGIGLIIAAMGFGIMGAFQINLPQSVYAVNPKADSAWGSFVFGVMTGVLGLPCFGFVAGALLAGVATQPALVSLAIFAGIGAGMAAPYLILSMNPKWLSKVPRTGPASELVKQVMGLLMIAAAAYFVGSGLIALVNERPYLGKQLHWWAIAIFASAAGVWLIVRTIQITKKPARRLVFGAIGLALGGLATLVALDFTANARERYEIDAAARAAAEGTGEIVTGTWISFSEPMLQRALDEGYVVVLDFTAEWCLNCKALKAAVLDRDPVRSALREKGVVTMTVDLTSTSAPGWDKLRSLGQTGIPTLAVYGPGLEGGPIISNAYTSQQVLGWLARARGETPGETPEGVAKAE